MNAPSPIFLHKEELILAKKCIKCEKGNISVSAFTNEYISYWIGYTYCPKCGQVYTTSKPHKTSSEAKRKAKKLLNIMLDIIGDDKTRLVEVRTEWLKHSNNAETG